MIDKNEFLTCDYYEKLVAELGREDIIHVPAEEVSDFFERTNDHTKLTVVSSFSDYSIRYQYQNHPNKDIIKFANATNWASLANIHDRYMAVQLGPACNKEKCDPADNYSVKIDRFTTSTFSRIPAGIKWFATNLDIVGTTSDHDISWLPFGVNNDGHGKDILANYRGRPKKGLLYVNFQNNSFDRFHYKNFFRNIPWVTFRENANLPVEQYYEELSEHKFVLSPFGNGLDCYRNYEAMYLGTVPILETSVMTDMMRRSGLPVMLRADLTGITLNDLNYEHINDSEFDCPLLTKSYWRKKIGG